MRIGVGEVAFEQTVFAFVFHHQRQMRGRGLGSGGCLRSKENGERMSAHRLDEEGAVGELVEFWRVHVAPCWMHP